METATKKIPSGYKSSPLGIIPEDWEVKRLGEVCTFHNGRAYNQKEFLSSGKYRVLRVGNFFTNSSWYWSDMELEDDKYANNGDLLYAWSASFGPRFWEGERVIYHYHIWKIDSFNKISKDFLYSFLLYDATKLTNTLQGGTMTHVTKENMEKRSIAVPPLPEQQRIVSLLSLWDTAIAKQTALIEKLTLRKRGLMQQLLTGKKRLKGFGGEWKEVRLGEIGVFFKGGGVPKDKITDTGNKCLTYGDLYTKYDFVISGVKSYIDDDTANESVKILYGDICFAGSGETKEDIGKCAAFIDNEFGYAGGDIIVFRATDYNPITLSYILNSNDVIRQKSNMGQGHSVVHIYPYQLEKLMIKLPSRAEQDAIATILIESDKEIEIQKQKLTALQEQKKGLMQVLLTGKRRVTI